MPGIFSPPSLLTQKPKEMVKMGNKLYRLSVVPQNRKRHFKGIVKPKRSKNILCFFFPSPSSYQLKIKKKPKECDREGDLDRAMMGQSNG